MTNLVASGKVIALIKDSEGLAKVRPDGMVEAYADAAHGWKVPTIGWGSTGSDIVKGTVWTVSQCEARLMKHIESMYDGIRKALGDAKTTQGQFDSFVDFVYNLGIGNFTSSTLLKLHKAGKTKEAADQFIRWNKANGKVLGGLTKRRLAERDLYLNG
jgi:lysozyme